MSTKRCTSKTLTVHSSIGPLKIPFSTHHTWERTADGWRRLAHARELPSRNSAGTHDVIVTTKAIPKHQLDVQISHPRNGLWFRASDTYPANVYRRQMMALLLPHRASAHAELVDHITQKHAASLSPRGDYFSAFMAARSAYVDPADLDAALSENLDHDTKEAALNNMRVWPSTLARHAKDSKSETRSQVALHPFTPQAVLRELANDRSVKVRRALAKNTNLQPNILALLADDPDEIVRINVGTHVDTPQKVLATLGASSSFSIREAVSMNRCAPAETLIALSVEFGVNVASNRGTPVAELMRLAADAGEGLQASVAGNASATTEVLEQLVGTDNEYVQLRLAGNPNTPDDYLERCASGRVALRSAVGRNHGAPAYVLARLASDTAEDVRGAVVSNPSITRQICRTLLEDPSHHIRDRVPMNPACPTDLRVASSAFIGYERLLIAELVSSKKDMTASEMIRAADMAGSWAGSVGSLISFVSNQ